MLRGKERRKKADVKATETEGMWVGMDPCYWDIKT